MPETFLVLLAAGVMLAVVVVNPNDVTVQWLRLAGILALALAGLSFFFYLRGDQAVRYGAGLYLLAGLLILGQLGFAQMAWRRVQRGFALFMFGVAVMLAACIIVRDGQHPNDSLRYCWPVSLLAASGIAALTGLALMDMLLGHAYLTASRMSMRPFSRLNNALGVAMISRILVAVGLCLVLLRFRPIELFWDRFGLLVVTRWLVGLVVPGVFVYMARDCINRRATQSATGILYVAGLLIFIGELIALHLVRETALPF